MRTCPKCKKKRLKFTHSLKICNFCYNERRDKYFAVQTGIKRQTNAKRRRARIEKNGGKCTEREWENIKKKYNYRCLRCGKREPDIKLEKDHIIPVASGGSSWPSNIQCLCKTCNLAKGSRFVDYRKVVWEQPNKKKEQ